MKNLYTILGGFCVFAFCAVMPQTFAVSMNGYGGDDVSCTMHADPETIEKNGGTTLKWTVSDNVVNAMLHPKGSTSWMQDVTDRSEWWITGIRDTRTYTLTVTGAQGQTAECDAEINVIDNNNRQPWCAIDAQPSMIPVDGGTTLTWTSSANVNKATLHPKNSTTWMQEVSPKGTWWITGIRDTRVYTLTVETQKGKTADCDVLITVVDPTIPPSCEMIADPDAIKKGGGTTLKWNSNDSVVKAKLHPTGSTSYFAYDLPADGSYWITGILDSRSYSLTVETADGQTATCDASITVKDRENKAPKCAIHAVPKMIKKGGGTTLKWNSSKNVVNATLHPTGSTYVIANGLSKKGSWWISGITNSRSYSLTVTTADGQSTTCDAPVIVKEKKEKPDANDELEEDLSDLEGELDA